jgi:pyruvate dehydrogenase E2 component (dihydrolipoamide acetyltransferase)
MQASKREVPHFYLLVDVDMGEATKLRGHCTRVLRWERPPSFTDLVAGACARALTVVPEANVSFRDGGLAERSVANVGIAVSVENGLVVPVLRDAAGLDLRRLSASARVLVERAREGRLRETDVDGRSLVVSNLGMHGVDAFVAIVDMPDPMILAVGRIADRCVVIDGVPAVRPTCTLTLSVDHRAFDGVLGARFLETVKEVLEDPWSLLQE